VDSRVTGTVQADSTVMRVREIDNCFVYLARVRIQIYYECNWLALQLAVTLIQNAQTYGCLVKKHVFWRCLQWSNWIKTTE